MPRPDYTMVTLKNGPKAGQSYRLQHDVNEVCFAAGEGLSHVYELKVPAGADRKKLLTAVAVYVGRRRR